MQTIQPQYVRVPRGIPMRHPNRRESEACSRTVVGLHILLGDFSGGLRNLAKNLVHLLQLGGPIVLGAVVCLLRGTIPLVDKGADLGVEVLQLLADALASLAMSVDSESTICGRTEIEDMMIILKL